MTEGSSGGCGGDGLSEGDVEFLLPANWRIDELKANKGHRVPARERVWERTDELKANKGAPEEGRARPAAGE